MIGGFLRRRIIFLIFHIKVNGFSFNVLILNCVDIFLMVRLLFLFFFNIIFNIKIADFSTLILNIILNVKISNFEGHRFHNCRCLLLWWSVDILLLIGSIRELYWFRIVFLIIKFYQLVLSHPLQLKCMRVYDFLCWKVLFSYYILLWRLYSSFVVIINIS